MSGECRSRWSSGSTESRPGLTRGLEFPLTLGVLALALLLMGPSFLSVDRAIGVER
jgi:hypothetical protein